jgi:hypothetical protein
LPESFPGIHFNEEGVCNICLGFAGSDQRKIRKAEYLARFEALLGENRGKSNYDVLMCYSGGKDSTHTLSILKSRYNLNILALTFDNGFIPDQTVLNIHTIVEKLGVDHIFFKPRFDMLSKIFGYCAARDIFPSKALERASSICSACMGIVKYRALRYAVEDDIPFIAFGWSPGQAPAGASIMKNNPLMVRKMQSAIYDPLYQIVGNDIRPYFLEDKHFSGSYHFPYYLYPLVLLDYNEDDIYKNILRLGWKAPDDVDANSTNCLLNSFANIVHKQRLGFHPYASGLANLVREGYIDRITALKRLNQQEDPALVSTVQEKLSLGDNS